MVVPMFFKACGLLLALKIESIEQREQFSLLTLLGAGKVWVLQITEDLIGFHVCNVCVYAGVGAGQE